MDAGASHHTTATLVAITAALGIVSGAFLPRPLLAFVAATTMLSSFFFPRANEQAIRGFAAFARLMTAIWLGTALPAAFVATHVSVTLTATARTDPAALPDMQAAVAVMLTLWWAAVVGIGAYGAIRWMLASNQAGNRDP